MNNEKKTFHTIIHYNYTDEFFDFLISRGRRVLSVHYGFGFQTDLIVWEC